MAITIIVQVIGNAPEEKKHSDEHKRKARAAR
jgi:hypothetical protein